MAQAIRAAASVRMTTAPNPWVGALVVAACRMGFEGATEPPGGRHAEIVAMDAARAAGVDVRGSTIYTTLEPCSHYGRTGPCVDALVEAGVARVVVGIEDPDENVSGRGLSMLREAGIDVTVGVARDAINAQLRSYLHHRRTGRPFVVLKLASTLDGRVSAADGSSQWITSEAARLEVHRLRAESQAVCVGAGTIRADDPALTVRHVHGPNPRRVVVGAAPNGAKVHPCLEWDGPLDELLDELGRQGVLQLLVEGGPRLAASFHRAQLVDRYVLHLAPAFTGGSDGGPVFEGEGAATIGKVWRGRIVSTRALGPDLEVVIEP
jgi:diaminohydroxyphosphoribosylaminopyrimidine deaminase/5-amino-6-(5-phosphoribosylamino)uracil reductase